MSHYTSQSSGTPGQLAPAHTSVGSFTPPPTAATSAEILPFRAPPRGGQLNADFAQAKAFLDFLQQGAAFTFCHSSDAEGGARYPEHLHGTLEEHFEQLQRFNRRRRGIFVTINETDGSGRRREENIVRVRALFVDLDEDGPERLQRVREFPLTPVTQPHS